MAAPTLPEPKIHDPNLAPRITLMRRLSTVRALFQQYVRIMAAYTATMPALPATMAERDEVQLVTSVENDTDYVHKAKVHLSQLRQRPVVPLGMLDANGPAVDGAAVTAAPDAEEPVRPPGSSAAAPPPPPPLPTGVPIPATKRRAPSPASSRESSPADSLASAGSSATDAVKRRRVGADSTKSLAAAAALGAAAGRPITTLTSLAKTRIKPPAPITYDDAYQYIMTDQVVIDWGYPTYDRAHEVLAADDRDTIAALKQLAADPTAFGSGAVDPVIRSCERCRAKFSVTPHPGVDECTYHPGRLRIVTSGGERIKEYSCCQGNMGSVGCVSGVHVWKDDSCAFLHGLVPFVVTPEVVEGAAKPVGYLPIVAMDCEMCYTTHGFELCRITAVDAQGADVLDELVKPMGSVLDLNTKYSGIESLDGAKETLESVRSKLLARIDQDTIFVGHGLENDFKVLRIIHPTIVDTAHVYPHPSGLPSRYSLRHLSSKLLGSFIQNQAEGGHDSLEDAKACLELLRKKIALPGLAVL
ncbi:RNA exonuclease 3 [Allomyces arbusculus]|nr:RNA exonuclease 3 [Allomyces arbusculus]